MKKILLLISVSVILFAQDTSSVAPPMIDISVSPLEQPEQFVKTLNITILMTFLVLAPSLLLMVTSFTRIIIVLALMRQSMGLQQTPPNQIIVSLALILTMFIMEPYAKIAYKNGIEPYIEKEIGYEEAFNQATIPFKDFMVKNTRESDLALFYRIRQQENPKNIADIPILTLMPAFLISELRTAFEIGFLIFLPFLVIDFIVSSVLMSLGMMMLPPVMISLPIKLIFFIIIDGWNLIIGNLVQSFK